jgi:UDP-GlcNAc:undecaprenyl-phosphate GlcNAc-1-phosphate transferase
LKNNPEWNYVPVGFIDDDPMKKDKLIHGLKVFDGNEMLDEICREKDVAEILISVRKMPPEQLKLIRMICDENDLILKRALLKIEPVDLV